MASGCVAGCAAGARCERACEPEGCYTGSCVCEHGFSADGRGCAISRPHLLMVIADDLGLHDVPFTNTGSEIRTPGLSSLAARGLVLDNYYVQPICTPTRAAFLTGRHPVQLGLQHGVIRDSVADAVPINETMLPQLLKRVGYRTHLVGKWHLGFYQRRYTPAHRGFDTAFGYYTGNTEYWNHTSPCWGCGNYTALDLHYEDAHTWQPITNATNRYSTELFTSAAVGVIERHAAEHGTTISSPSLFLYLAFEAVHGASSCFVGLRKAPDCEHPTDDELQAPEQYVRAQAHIGATNRRIFAGMVGALDEGVYNVSSALDRTGLGKRALLLFTTDNGAPYKHLGGATMSNWPLRGGKGELWEGGIRGAAFLFGGALPSSLSGHRSPLLCHASDWLPTFARLAGVALGSASVLYGKDIWGSLMHGNHSHPYAVRSELLHNIDPSTGQQALRLGDFKLLVGVPESGWGPDPRTNDTPTLTGGPADFWSADQRNAGHGIVALYNVALDPREMQELSGDPEHAQRLVTMRSRLSELAHLGVPLRNAPPVTDAKPRPEDALRLCTPSPVGPILCDQPIGVWQPWDLVTENESCTESHSSLSRCAPGFVRPDATNASDWASLTDSWEGIAVLGAFVTMLAYIAFLKARDQMRRELHLKAAFALEEDGDDVDYASSASAEVQPQHRLDCPSTCGLTSCCSWLRCFFLPLAYDAIRPSTSARTAG